MKQVHKTKSLLLRTMNSLNITNFTLLHSPPSCQGRLTALLVLSSPQNFNRRRIIRQTWAKNYKVNFLLGETLNEEVQNHINAEADIHQDIVQGTFMDTYRNLTHKTLMGLSWAHDTCTTDFVLKADDDMIVNVLNIERYLQKIDCQRKVNSLDPEEPITSTPPEIYCDLLYGSRVYRVEGYKWTVTFEEYANETFPTYCQGALGMLYSKKSIPLLLEQMDRVGFLWLEDVYVSGILRDAARLTLTQIDDNLITLYKEDFDTDETITETLLGPGGLEEEEMINLWKMVEEKRSEKKSMKEKQSTGNDTTTSQNVSSANKHSRRK